jgi:hypothetical protein
MQGDVVLTRNAVLMTRSHRNSVSLVGIRCNVPVQCGVYTEHRDRGRKSVAGFRHRLPSPPDLPQRPDPAEARGGIGSQELEICRNFTLRRMCAMNRIYLVREGKAFHEALYAAGPRPKPRPT